MSEFISHRHDPPVIALTIAGSDSGGGAGIQADLKTFQALGVFGTSVLTAVTAQNTVAVHGVEALSTDMVTAQIDAIRNDLPPAALKTGMLADSAIITVVARSIREMAPILYVLDPVMVATSGDRLLEPEAERCVATELLPLATIVTPNAPEAEALTGIRVEDEDSMREAGRRLIAMGAGAALVKGGHGADGGEILDLLVEPTGERAFRHPRINTANTHGTGCTLSAAVAAGLALGRSLDRAVEDAIAFVQAALRTAPGVGKGHGPLNHALRCGVE